VELLMIYQFCSFGGVERVLLNRAIAFKNAQLNIKMSICYLHDSGALRFFRDYIILHDLEQVIEPLLLNTSSDDRLGRTYDLILVIDTPEVLPDLAGRDHVYVECHSPYWANRQYLRNIPKGIRGVIVPSESLRILIQKDFRNLPPIHTISNPVPDEFFQYRVPVSTTFQKRPISYLARLDSLKNIREALDVFECFKDVENTMFFIVGEGAIREDFLRSLRAKGIMNKAFLRNSLPFDKIPLLVSTIRAHRGVFISSSKGESFGLSVAEFMAGGVPVLVSDIPAHRELVNGNDNFLYALGDVDSASKKISLLLENWDRMSDLMGDYANRFREGRFINEWLAFLSSVN
jgi:glycosyltransferase involved in cell wall biosynthesis